MCVYVNVCVCVNGGIVFHNRAVEKSLNRNWTDRFLNNKQITSATTKHNIKKINKNKRTNFPFHSFSLPNKFTLFDLIHAFPTEQNASVLSCPPPIDNHTCRNVFIFFCLGHLQYTVYRKIEKNNFEWLLDWSID